MSENQTIMILKGDEGRAILTVTGEQDICYHLSKSLPEEVKLVLFERPERWQELAGCEGQERLYLSRILAAAAVCNDQFILSGEKGKFDWQRARAEYALSRTGGHQRSCAPKEDEVDKEPELPPPSVRSSELAEEVEIIETAQGQQGLENVMVERSAAHDRAEKIKADLSIEKRPDEITLYCHTQKSEEVQPFPYLFRESRWHRISYPLDEGSYYLTGEIFHKGELVATAVAVPGEYAPAPPKWLHGFESYLYEYDRSHGYWVCFRDGRTGKFTSLQVLIAMQDAL